jgi:hypothetical protein
MQYRGPVNVTWNMAASPGNQAILRNDTYIPLLGKTFSPVWINVTALTANVSANVTIYASSTLKLRSNLTSVGINILPSLSTSANAGVNDLFPITYFKLSSHTTMAGFALDYPLQCTANYSTSVSNINTIVVRNNTYYGNLGLDYYFAVTAGNASCPLSIYPNGNNYLSNSNIKLS